MVEHPCGQHQVKSTLLPLEGREANVAAPEPAPAPEPLFRRRDVFGTDVQASVINLRQGVQNVGRTAADIEDFLARHRLHILGQVHSPYVSADDAGEKPVTRWETKNRGEPVNDLHGRGWTTAFTRETPARP